MRVALFGGSFDPPHRGHVALAWLARQRLVLDRVLVAPVAMQPLKLKTPPAAFDDRVAMTRLAFATEPGTEISLIDAGRPDGASNYTIDTLANLRRQLTPEDTLFCIMGADSFLTIRKWHRSADMLTTCDVIVGARPGFDLNQVEAVLPRGLSVTPLAPEFPHTRTFELTADNNDAPQRKQGAARLYLLTDLAEEISATQIRSALRGDAGTAGVLNPAVVEYIRSHHLYTHL